MANPIRGEVAIKAGDDEFTLAFDVNRICELEGLLGHKVADLLVDIRGSQGLNMTVLRAALWAGLRAYDLSLAEAGDVLQAMTPIAASSAVVNALALAFPKPEGGANPRKRAPKASNGTSKTSSPAG